MMQSRSASNRPQGPSGAAARGAISRATKYMWRYRWQAILPYLFLLVATLSMLAVPRLVRNVIDAVTNGVIAKQLLERLPTIPSQYIPAALPQILSFLKLPADMSLDQLMNHLSAEKSGAP